MLRVIYANSLELLTAVLGEAMPHGDPFAKTEIVVSHPIVGRWLMLRLAQQHGGVAGVTTSLLDKFALQTAMAQASLPLAPLSRAALTSLIASELAQDAALAGALRLDGAGGIASRRRIETAELLASLLLQYARTRPAWLDAWGDGKLDEGVVDATQALAWQPRLYRAIMARAQRGLRARGGDALPVMAPRALRAVAKRHKAISVETSPLHVIGFSYLAVSDLETLKIISMHRPVTMYQLNPSADYWLDTPRRTGEFAKQRAFAPEEAAGASLRLWATPVRDTLAWLLEHADEVDGLFALPTATRDNAFLRWQQRILAPSSEAPIAANPLDGSVQLHACPSPLRELEVALDSLLARMAVDEGCALTEVALLVAGAGAERYLALAPFVFATRGGVPMVVADAAPAERRAMADGLIALLQLAQAPVTKTSLLAVMCHEGLTLATPEQRQAWPDLAERLGIFVGADNDDVAETYLAGSGAAHWEQGLARLALAAFMSGPALGDLRAANVNEAAWLPADWAASSPEAAAEFAAAARRVLSDRQTLATASMPLTRWCDRVWQLVDIYGAGSSDEATRDRLAVHAALETLRATDFDGRELDVAEFALRLAGVAESRQAAHAARLLSDGIYVGLLSTMRPLPFRHIAVVGLADQAFPQPSQTSPLDLRIERRRGDVTTHERDRQAFFDTLLATRATADLCYLARAPSDGTPLEPSPVLAELARTLVPSTGVAEALAALTVTHPLYAWDDATLPGEATVAQARAFVAPATTLPALPEASAWRKVFGIATRVPGAPRRPQKISISSLRKFLERPADGWAQVALGLAQQDDAPVAEHVADTEAFRASGLDAAVAVREALVACWQARRFSRAAIDEALAAAIAKRQVTGHWPLARLGEAQAAQWAVYLERWLALPQLRAEQAVRRWRFGAANATAQAGLLPAALRLDLNVAGTAHQLEIVGMSECVGEYAGATLLHTRAEPDDLRAWLRLGLDRVVCAAAGVGGDAHAEATMLLRPALTDLGLDTALWFQTAALPAWTQAAAQRYLRGLLEDLLSESHAYRIDLKKPLTPVEEPPTYAAEFLDDREFGPPPDLADLVGRRYAPLLTASQWEACTETSRKKAAAAKDPAKPPAKAKGGKKAKGGGDAS